MNTMPLEADTRLLIDRSLENLGWNLTGKDKNVFFEQPKTEMEQRKLEYKRPDYVLYSKDHEPLIVIEAKRRGGRIDKALEQGIFYAERLKAPLVFATDGVFCKAFHTEGHRTPLLNGNELDEFIREALALKFLGNWKVNTISPKVQYDRKELIKIFDNANNMLRGDGLRAGIERFGEFANILFIKLLSEKGNINDACSWNTIKKMPVATRINYINSTVYKTLNSIYNTEIFTPLTMQDNYILSEIMDSLDPLTLTDVDSDVKGDAFEYFLKASTASGNDLGEYFTPRHIVKTMVRLTNPKIGEKVYDPFCGTGGFLIESFRHIYNNMPRNQFTEMTLRENTIFGNEITNTARITKMNMILAGDGHSGIHKRDSLANPVEGKYDIVLANMPYSQKTKWGNLYDVPSKNGDSVCVQHCIKAIASTSENGRMALVVPEGFLFRKDLKKTREYMLEHCELKSIISLPQGVFLPYTGVKTNIIYAEKVNQKIPSSLKGKHYWYFEVKNDGYSLDNYRRKLDTPSDLQKFEEYRKLDENEQNTMLEIGFDIVPFEKVKEKDFNFVGSRYREKLILNNNYSNVFLNEIAVLIRGISFKKDERKLTNSNTDIGIVTTRAAQEDGILKEHIQYIDEKFYRQEKILQKGDILISLANSLNLVGRVTYINRSYNNISFGTFMGCIRADKNKILPQYLFYILKSQYAKNYFLTTARTTTNISNLTFEDLENFSFPLPPLEIQEKIVAELENYQNIIDGAKKIIMNYKPKLPSINGQFICLDNLFLEIKNGKNVKQSTEPGLYHVSRIESISQGIFDINKTKYTNDRVNPNDFLEKGDILFSHINSYEHLAKTALFNEEIDVIHGCNLIKLKPDITKIIPKYALYIFKSDDFLKQAKLFAQRAVNQASIRVSDLKTLKILVPDLKEQEEIVAQLEAEQELINANKQIIEIFTKKIQDTIDNLFKE